jgi:hypothetical protein
MCVRMRNLQNTTRGARHVEDTYQFPHAGRIDVRKPRQVQQNSPLATAKPCLDPLA